MNDSLDVDYSEHAPNGKHNCHWHKRLARAAAYCGYRVRERKQAVKQRDRASLTDSEVKHFGRRVEKSDKRGGENIVQNAYAAMVAAKIPKRAPFLARSNSLAPRFWLINVVVAILKLVIGKNAKPSILA